MTRKTMIAAMAVVAAACGGSDRATRSFSYNTPVSVTASSAAAAAALTVEDSTKNAAELRAMDSTSAPNVGASVATLPDVMQSSIDAVAVPLRSALMAGETPTERTLGTIVARLATDTGAVVQAGCATVTATSVTFTNCSATASDTTADVSVTLNGSIEKVSQDQLKWNLTATMSGGTSSGSGSSFGLDAQVHYFGDLTVTATSIDGFAQSDKSFNGSVEDTTGVGRITFSGAQTSSVDFQNLTFVAGSCITGGSVELKRFWTDGPKVNGQDVPRSSDPSLADRGLLLSWQGDGASCASAFVATSK